MAAVPSIGRASRVQPAAAPEADLTRALYEKYANQIFRYCLHQLGSREEAEDAVQSTFLNAFRGIKGGVVPELESAWLFKIANNVCLSRRRSSWRRGRIESPADFDLVEELTPAPSRQADELIGLQDVLEQMPENQRRAILLREWQGLSYHEIAEELELSQAAVETLIFRARRSLAHGLEQPADKKRRLVRGADWANVLAGMKSLLLGSSVAVKVAATVAVVSATTVVASAPVQHHSAKHHSTPVSQSPIATAMPAGAAVAPSRPAASVVPPAHPAHGLAASPVRPLAVPAADPATTPAAVDAASAPADTQPVSVVVQQTPATQQDSPPAATPPAQTDSSDSGSSTAPGQTKKQDSGSTPPPGQATEQDSGSSDSSGQAKKQDGPPAVVPVSAPPATVTLPASTSTTPAPAATPSGQAKKQDDSGSNDQSSNATVPQPNPALNSPFSGSTGAVPASVQEAANAARNNGNGDGNGGGSSSGKGKGK